MRCNGIWKVLVLGMVLFSSWSCSCTQVLQSNCEPSSLSSSAPNNIPKDSHFTNECPWPSTDLKALLAVLDLDEKRVRETKESNPGTSLELPHLCFIIGELVGRDEKMKYFEKGRYYAELLAKTEPSRVEGHYWLALNLCGVAEVDRVAVALQLVPDIVVALQVALSIDETYEQAGPHRVLGRIYGQAPSWPLSEGDLEKSLHHLRRAVEIAPGNGTNHLYLAETLIEMGMSEEARRELEIVLNCVDHTLPLQGLDEDRREAMRLLVPPESDGESMGRP